MQGPGRRGPHLICYRCDSLAVEAARCLYCDYWDMVELCLAEICAACSGQRTVEAAVAAAQNSQTGRDERQRPNGDPR
jgi:hypothetical protein